VAVDSPVVVVVPCALPDEPPLESTPDVVGPGLHAPVTHPLVGVPVGSPVSDVIEVTASVAVAAAVPSLQAARDSPPNRAERREWRLTVRIYQSRRRRREPRGEPRAHAARLVSSPQHHDALAERGLARRDALEDISSPAKFGGE
jgi:hypothetical protein